ncbi:uncharacterized protein C2845_PM07G37600 [Panicum miliaceum]|uniref:Uncharacterized protein n=1 Tax=Panicum miliaceum TaxID=4540 RepID=A0A3L6SKK9_PANMI|nr:uncharacterized protein C2845_PM07G37600 [Panicum miliaceum]
MGGEATSAGRGGFRARMEHYLYSGEKKHVLAGMAIFAAVFGVPWYFMTRGLLLLESYSALLCDTRFIHDKASGFAFRD